jgi:hypothetical protein
MNACKLIIAASAGLLICASTSLAAPPAGLTFGPPASVTMGPPAGVTMGPPASVTMGPPPSVTMGPPATVTMGPPAAALAHIPASVSLGAGVGAQVEASAASELGKLNAAHASTVALDHAASNSAVGAIATYESQMNAALALEDPAAQDAAITAARQQLAQSTNKDLTASAVTRIDAMLGITGASPTLGTTP